MRPAGAAAKPIAKPIAKAKTKTVARPAAKSAKPAAKSAKPAAAKKAAPAKKVVAAKKAVAAKPAAKPVLKVARVQKVKKAAAKVPAATIPAQPTSTEQVLAPMRSATVVPTISIAERAKAIVERLWRRSPRVSKGRHAAVPAALAGVIRSPHATEPAPVDESVVEMQRRVEELAAQLRDGKISVEQWRTQMAEFRAQGVTVDA